MGLQVLNNADAAYAAMARWFSSDTAIVEAAAEGYSVLSLGSVVAGTNSGTVKVSAGTDQFGLPQVTYALTDNIACAANADVTNPRWQLIEVDSAGVAQSNLGTAAATPVPPTPTAGRVVHAAVYIPANATTVDALLSTANGKAKIIDKRVLAAGNRLQTFSNADVTVASATRLLLQTGTMSALRTITLPAASAVAPGTPLTMVDVSGTVSGTFPWLIARAGLDTINGGTASFAMAVPYGAITFVSDGSSKWTGLVAGIPQGGTGQTTALAAFDAFAPTTTRGDITYRGATTSLRLAKGTSGQFLKIGANDPAWASIAASDVANSYSNAGTDTTVTSQTNPTALTSLLNATFAIAGNSLAAGDVLHIVGSGNYTNSQNASTIELQLLFGSTTIFDWTTDSLNTSANPRKWVFEMWVSVKTASASGVLELGGWAEVGLAGTANLIQTVAAYGGGANGSRGVISAQFTSVDLTASNAIDLKAKVTTSSSTSTVNLRVFRINKYAA